MNYVYVAIGSAAGGLARFALGGWLQRRLGMAFPIGTLVVCWRRADAVDVEAGVVTGPC